MSWWGKLIGGTFGFMIGGPLGAVLGAALGHNFDRGLDSLPGIGTHTGQQQRIQTAFFTAVFSVMGHICKADGQVSRDEIRIARQVMAQMALNPEQQKAAIALFNEGKQAGFPLEDVLLQLRSEIGHRMTLRTMFIEILCLAVHADNKVHPAERRLLEHVGDVLGVSNAGIDRLLASVGAKFHHRQGKTGSPRSTINDAYAVLGISARVSDAEIKKAYRRLMSQHHPDKLVAKGLPEEMMKLAAERTHEIRQAYETIREQRGF